MPNSSSRFETDTLRLAFWVLVMKFRFLDEWIRHFEDTKWAK